MRKISLALIGSCFFFLASCDFNPAAVPNDVQKNDISKVLENKSDQAVLNVSIKASTSNITVNQPIEFFLTYLTHKNNIKNVYFDFNNDGTYDMSYNSQATSSMYTYTAVGKKTVKVVVVDDQNYVDSKTVVVNVE